MIDKKRDAWETEKNTWQRARTNERENERTNAENNLMIKDMDKLSVLKTKQYSRENSCLFCEISASDALSHSLEVITVLMISLSLSRFQVT